MIKMKVKQNLLLTLLVCASLAACNESNQNTGNAAPSLSKYEAKGTIPQQLEAKVYSHDESGAYLSTTDTQFFSMIQLTNSEVQVTQITKAPVFDTSTKDKTDFSIITDSSFYPVGTTICAEGTSLRGVNNHVAAQQSIPTSCMLLIKAENNNTAQKVETTLNITARDSIYRFKVAKSPIIYIGGDFSEASILSESGVTKKLTAFNSGTCGFTTDKACMLISYDPISKQIKKVAETDNEIYALAADKSGALYACGAFSSLSTKYDSLSLPSAIIDARRGSSLVAKINPFKGSATVSANTNQSVFAITTSGPLSNQDKVYLTGAFGDFASGLSTTARTNGGSCPVVELSGVNWFVNNSTRSPTYAMAATPSELSNPSSADNVLLTGKFAQINGDLLSSGTDSYKSPAPSLALVSCIGNNCKGNTPVYLKGPGNAVAVSGENKILMSGYTSSLPGIESLTERDLVIADSSKSLGEAKWTKVAEMDGAILAILPIGSSYYIGGQFSAIKGQAPAAGQGLCGPSYNSCLLAENVVVAKDITTKKILTTNGKIAALAASVILSVSAK